eukprot:gene16579-20261_t
MGLHGSASAKGLGNGQIGRDAEDQVEGESDAQRQRQLAEAAKVIISADAGSRGGKVVAYKPLLDEAWASVDPAVREPIYAKLQEMSYEYATTQFLWEDFGYVVTRSNIDGYVDNMILYGAWDFYPVTK